MKFFIKQQQKQTIFTNYTLIYIPIQDKIKQGSIHMALQFVLNHLVI